MDSPGCLTQAIHSGLSRVLGAGSMRQKVKLHERTRTNSWPHSAGDRWGRQPPQSRSLASRLPKGSGSRFPSQAL